MREILFRGKIIELCEYQGQWLEGFYAVENGKPFIAIPKENGLNGFYCDPETVGQYTGLKDVHNMRIFEGDVVKDITPLYKGLTPGVREELLKERAKKRGIAVVKFGYHDVKADDPYCIGRAYGVYFEGDMELTTPAQYYGYGDWQESEDYQFEVIGNIWDNPELLEGDKT